MNKRKRMILTLSSLALIPTTQLFVNDTLASPKIRIEWRRFLIKTGLKTFS